jgi:hypothetical protein
LATGRQLGGISREFWFGARIVQEKVFEDTGGARRTDSGVVQIQRQLPVFTQGVPAYDVLVAADESEVFASFLPYRTWEAVHAGSNGQDPLRGKENDNTVTIIDLERRDIEHIDHISDEMRAVVESEWPELAHKLPPQKPQG